MPIRYRFVCWFGALAFAVTLTATLAPQARADDTVRIAVGVDPVYTPWWIAQTQGFYAKYGINAQLTQLAGGPDVGDATMAGEADIGSSGTATLMPRLVRGGLLVIGTMATSPDALRMAALTSITSLDDLKGKKVGTVAGSTTDYLWVLLARKLNVPDSTFTLVATPPPELVPSLDRHDIDAFFCWEPWPSRAVEVSGKDKVRILANSGDVGYLLNFIVVANDKFAAAHPDDVSRVLAALRDAIDYQNTHPTEAAQIGGDKNRLKPDIAGNIIKLYQFHLGFAPEMVTAVKTEEAWMRTKDRLKGAPIDWDKTIDYTYLDRAMTMK